MIRKGDIMSIGLTYVDATSIEMEDEKEAFECKRFPAPVLAMVSENDQVVITNLFCGELWSEGKFADSLRSASFRRRTVSLDVFETRFEQLFIGKDAKPNVFALKQGKQFALQMPFAFGVHVIAEDGIYMKEGVRGDYLIQTRNGLNDIVSADIFARMYQTSNLHVTQVACPEMLDQALKMARVRFPAISCGSPMR
ncbi:hypothetical protein ACI2KR_07250 [Pseudomonas luteola]